MKGKPHLRHFKFNQNTVNPINIIYFGTLEFCLQSPQFHIHTHSSIHTLLSKYDKRNIVTFIQYMYLISVYLSVTVDATAATAADSFVCWS